jgi:hypothetical protein
MQQRANQCARKCDSDLKILECGVGITAIWFRDRMTLLLDIWRFLKTEQAASAALANGHDLAPLAWLCQVPARPVPVAGRGARIDPLLGRLTRQLTKDQYPVLLE